MFWRMAGLSTASPVETILDKDNYTLEELLDEDEIIQECKALNARLINFLREKVQVEQLLRYIVEEPPEDAEKKRTFKFPFIACEIFTCEVDIILKTLVEDEELMNLLFSYLEPKQSHSTLLAGYFSKVVICLLLRKTAPFLSYIQAHREIVQKLVDLIGITSIMEVLIRLVGADEHMYSNYAEAMQWIQDTDVLEIIVDKFSSSDSPEVHANAAETLCAITRYAPAGLSAKISSPSFVQRLFRHALEESRPKSVLINALMICISLLDPKRLPLGTYPMFGLQMMPGSSRTANPETVEGMLESVGDLLSLLDFSSSDNVLLTTYGKLQPPLGKHRLKIVEFISVLLAVGSEAAEKELIRLGAVKRILDLMFEYPYNNFVHHHIENIIIYCLESKNASLVEHLLRDCGLVDKIIEAEKNFLLTASNKPTIPAEGRSPPRVGNIGHLTRISNKLIQLGNTNSNILAYLKENSEWSDHASVMSKRNAVENVYQWGCGRPTALQDRGRDSDDDDYQDRDYDVAALANNLSQALRYGIYNNSEMDEGHGSLERDDEDVYFDDESAEVVISSLRLGDEQDSGSLFTNSNWFAFEDDSRVSNDRSAGSLPSPSPSAEGTNVVTEAGDALTGRDEDLVDTASSSLEPEMKSDDTVPTDPKETTESKETDKPPEWVEWRETSDSGDPSDDNNQLPNGELPAESPEEEEEDDDEEDEEGKPSPSAASKDDEEAKSKEETPATIPHEPSAASDDEEEAKSKETTPATVPHEPSADSANDAKTAPAEQVSCQVVSGVNDNDDKKENEVQGN